MKLLSPVLPDGSEGQQSRIFAALREAGQAGFLGNGVKSARRKARYINEINLISDGGVQTSQLFLGG